jgi:hypothetical protein
MKVKLLTLEQKNLLVGAEITDSLFANPFLDADGNHILSLQEVADATNPDYLWINELPEIDYVPIPLDLSQFNVN